MAIDIVASKFKSARGRGQAQDLTGAWTDKKELPIIPNVAPPNADAKAGMDFQVRKVSSAQKVPTAFGMSAPKASSKVPLSNVRRANDGLFRATKR